MASTASAVLSTVYVAARAAPTPVTDGKTVYVFFADFGLAAYDLAEGTPRWQLPLGPFNSQHGIVACMTAAFAAEGVPAPEAAAVRRVIGLPLEEAVVCAQEAGRKYINVASKLLAGEKAS